MKGLRGSNGPNKAIFAFAAAFEWRVLVLLCAKKLTKTPKRPSFRGRNPNSRPQMPSCDVHEVMEGQDGCERGEMSPNWVAATTTTTDIKGCRHANSTQSPLFETNPRAQIDAATSIWCIHSVAGPGKALESRCKNKKTIVNSQKKQKEKWRLLLQQKYNVQQTDRRTSTGH